MRNGMNKPEMHTRYIIECVEWWELQRVIGPSTKFPLVCVVTRQGSRCGYLGLPPDHPYYGNNPFEYDEDTGIPLDCHYGLTFGTDSKQQSYPVNFIYGPHYHWIGFDCFHSTDKPDPNYTAPEYSNLDCGFHEPGATVKSVKFVMDNLYSMAEQLCGISSKDDMEHHPSLSQMLNLLKETL